MNGNLQYLVWNGIKNDEVIIIMIIVLKRDNGVITPYSLQSSIDGWDGEKIIITSSYYFVFFNLFLLFKLN